MRNIFFSIALCIFLFAGALVCSGEMPQIGMTKTEVIKRFGAGIFTQSTAGDNITLRMPAFGIPANVFVGFLDEKASFISISFTSFLTKSDHANRLTVFRTVRKRLQDLDGDEYSYARVGDVDLLGESGGWITDTRRRNAFVFGKDHKGIRFHLEIFAEAINEIGDSGEVSLTITAEETTQSPAVQRIPEKPHTGPK